MPLAAMVCDVHGVVALARTEEGADSDGAPLHTQRISLAAHELSRSMALLAPLSARAFQSEQRDGLLLFGMRDGGEQTFVCIGSRPERSFAAFALLGEMAALWRCRHAYSDTEWSAQLRSALLGHAAALYEGAPPPSARALASPHSSPHSSPHLIRQPLRTIAPQQHRAPRSNHYNHTPDYTCYTGSVLRVSPPGSHRVCTKPIQAGRRLLAPRPRTRSETSQWSNDATEQRRFHNGGGGRVSTGGGGVSTRGGGGEVATSRPHPTLPHPTLSHPTVPHSTLPSSTLPSSTPPNSTPPNSTPPNSTPPSSTLPHPAMPPRRISSPSRGALGGRSPRCRDLGGRGGGGRGGGEGGVDPAWSPRTDRRHQVTSLTSLGSAVRRRETLREILVPATGMAPEISMADRGGGEGGGGEYSSPINLEADLDLHLPEARLVISGGASISPREIEEALLTPVGIEVRERDHKHAHTHTDCNTHTPCIYILCNTV